MPVDRAGAVERLRAERERAGLFLDFDGTLSEIVARPDLATPVPGATEVLSGLAERFPLVAVVSGRPADAVRALLPVPRVEVFGLYGLDEGTAEGSRVPEEARRRVEAVAASVAGAWVEDKGRSVAVHYRGVADPEEAGRGLREALAEVARTHGLRVLPGKMVVELAPAETPGKGTVVEREVSARGLTACLYAGDDEADLHAFEALDRLRAAERFTVKVAVRSEETPADLVSAADVVVERPAGLVELLEELTA